MEFILTIQPAHSVIDEDRRFVKNERGSSVFLKGRKQKIRKDS
ncbi:hypothetical protein J2X77_004115 [Sphingobacterium sp. 2149]|nr:hypothetical protein [Sphingobacterium sp. 2149]